MKTRGDNDTLESKIRSENDVALGVRIDGEITRSTNAESSLFQTLDGGIQAESKVRFDADLALSNRINFLTMNTDQSKLDSLSEIVNRMNSSGSDIYSRLSLLEDVVGILRNQALYSVPKGPYSVDIPPTV